jgi:hypothetical protein
MLRRAGYRWHIIGLLRQRSVFLCGGSDPRGSVPYEPYLKNCLASFAKPGSSGVCLILSLDVAPISDSRDLDLKVSMMASGTTVNLKVLRDGRRTGATVTLGEMPGTVIKDENSEGGKVPSWVFR